MVVDRIPNSGWPGRPRNVGTRLATGEYVFYADHDDYLFPEALERMHRFAVRAPARRGAPQGGREGLGPTRLGGVPPPPARTSSGSTRSCCSASPRTSSTAARSWSSRTSWFPEGRVRLEDFSLNGLAWSRTDAIGVMADYPCYQWIIHQENSHKASYDYDVYWRSFVESLAPVLELPEGDKRDQLLIRWYKSRVLERVKALHGWPEDHVTRLLGTFAGLLPLFPPSLDAKLHPADRARSALLRAGDRARLLALGELDHGHHLAGRLDPDDLGRRPAAGAGRGRGRGPRRPAVRPRAGRRPRRTTGARRPRRGDRPGAVGPDRRPRRRHRRARGPLPRDQRGLDPAVDEPRGGHRRPAGAGLGGRRGGPRHVRGRLAARHGVATTRSSGWAASATPPPDGSTAPTTSARPPWSTGTPRCPSGPRAARWRWTCPATSAPSSAPSTSAAPT